MAMSKAEEAAAVAKFKPLVMKVARRYADRFSSHGVDFDDLVQEGFIGALHAIRNWQPDKGACLWTYCNQWIGGYVSRLVRKKTSIFNCGKPRPRPEDLSLEEMNEHGETLHERLAAPGPSPEEIASNRLDAFVALRALSAREVELISDRFANDATLETAGKALGVSKERARQIESAAMGRMGKALNACR